MGLGADPRVVYFRAYDSLGVQAFYRIPVTGGRPQLVARLDETSRQPARIVFSTDGRRLYFTLTEAESDIWVMTLGR